MIRSLVGTITSPQTRHNKSEKTGKNKGKREEKGKEKGNMCTSTSPLDPPSLWAIGGNKRKEKGKKEKEQE